MSEEELKKIMINDYEAMLVLRERILQEQFKALDKDRQILNMLRIDVVPLKMVVEFLDRIIPEEFKK